MTTKLNISIDTLQKIASVAILEKIADRSLSDIVEITVTKPTDSHNGEDKIEVWLKSSYAECNGTKLI